MILPLDTHAHIEPDISPSDLDTLRSCVVAVTRRLGDFTKTQGRADASVVWAAGCHPGLVREVNTFSAARMKAAIAATPIVGEVGLDGAARTPMEAQVAVLREVFALTAERPRVLSIHSYRATGLVLQQLTEFRPPAAVLHWWLGSPEETRAAVDLGAYFSINASQATKWRSLPLLPLERVLLETDHPFGDRAESRGRRPGNLLKAEQIVSAEFRITAEAVRRQSWRNFKTIAEELHLVEMFPQQFQVQFLAL
jgi:TatD DNase family protein